MNLLLVGNDQTFRDMLQIRLEAAGFRVTAAHSLVELKAAASRTWDLVVSDSEFENVPFEELVKHLAPSRNPLFIYTQQNVDEVAPLWKAKGAREVFSRLRRGDLIKAAQTLNPTPTATVVQGKKFLLVDDSPTIRKFVKKIIEKDFPGSEVFEAEDGKTAMHELTGQKMDLIVTDMQMPGVDGLSFIKTLHRNPLLSKKPILILSGMVTQEMQSELGTVPTVRILSKPAEPGAIVQTIQSLLSPTATPDKKN